MQRPDLRKHRAAVTLICRYSRKPRCIHAPRIPRYSVVSGVDLVVTKQRREALATSASALVQSRLQVRVPTDVTSDSPIYDRDGISKVMAMKR